MIYVCTAIIPEEGKRGNKVSCTAHEADRTRRPRQADRARPTAPGRPRQADRKGRPYILDEAVVPTGVGRRLGRFVTFVTGGGGGVVVVVTFVTGEATRPTARVGPTFW